jgi:hypothetical protein
VRIPHRRPGLPEVAPAGWPASRSASLLRRPDLCPLASFDDPVSFRQVDMRVVPGDMRASTWPGRRAASSIRERRNWVSISSWTRWPPCRLVVSDTGDPHVRLRIADRVVSSFGLVVTKPAGTSGSPPPASPTQAQGPGV